jgi:two-component system sensor histidine kinase/response regulator
MAETLETLRRSKAAEGEGAESGAALGAEDTDLGILIVDDHGPNLVAMEATLAPLGYRIVTASSGAQALTCALAHDFVMIVMDVHMAGLDGYQTTALLRQRERSRDVPVIFVTAVYNQPEHTYRGYALGAVDYISKPFDADILRAKVRALVSLYVRGQRLEKQRSREVDRTKDIFLGAVGHDLRNPLNSIVMASKLLALHECSNDTHRKHALRIERATSRMNHMIEDILDLTRGRFGERLPLALRRVDLGDLCRSVVGELRVSHPERQIDLDVSGNVVGDWDPSRLGRVVSNLVGNALRYSAGGTVRVKVSDQGDEVALSVQNRGEPIPEEALARLFEPFRRGGASREGMGLGLYIVSEVVRAHGGTVGVTSTAADGTTFTVGLPRIPAQDLIATLPRP